MDPVEIDPAILYLGTPVALLSTVSGDGRPNLAPMSSAFWLGRTAVLGMGVRLQTTANLRETGELVIALPSVALVDAVDRLALTTGRDPVPDGKVEAGYRHEPDKFARAGLTPLPSRTVRPAGVLECPVNLEARVLDASPLQEFEPGRDAGTVLFQADVTRVVVHEDIRVPGAANRIDPDRWRPLVMSFQRFYGLGAEAHPSRLATIDEEWYRELRPEPAADPA